MARPIIGPSPDLTRARNAREALETARADYDLAIATCLAEGRSLAQIAEAIGVSKSTVSKVAQRLAASRP